MTSGLAAFGIPSDQLAESARGPLAELPQKALGAVSGALRNAAVIVSYLLLLPIYLFYILLDFERLGQGVLRLLPHEWRGEVERVGLTIHRTLAAFFRVRLYVGLMKGAFYAAGLLLLGVRSAVLLGGVAGILSFVPLVGVVAGLVPALAFAFLDEGLPLAIAVATLFAVGEFLEGYVVLPRLLGEAVSLHPLAILVSLLAGGTLFGFFGLILAVPVAAALRTLLEEWNQRRERAEQAAGGSPGRA
jgi:predicted PurR-regulated permease PerM